MWHIHAQISFGASGAPTIEEAKGVVSIVRNNTGLYTINLRDQFGGFMHASHTPMLAAGAPAAPEMVIRSIANINASSPSIQVAFLDSAGAAADPASGEQVFIHLVLKNTTK